MIEEITVEECMRRWELPGNHPDSWVQINATYRDIWGKAIEAAAKVAEDLAEEAPMSRCGAEYMKGCWDAAAKIRALKP